MQVSIQILTQGCSPLFSSHIEFLLIYYPSTNNLVAGSMADTHVELCILVLQTLVDCCRAGRLASFWSLAVKVLSF